MFETQINYEPNTNKIDAFANQAAYVGGLAIKNFVKVVFLHGRPNQPFASHGDHLPSHLEQKHATQSFEPEQSGGFNVRYVPDTDPDSDYYY